MTTFSMSRKAWASPVVVSGKDDRAGEISFTYLTIFSRLPEASKLGGESRIIDPRDSVSFEDEHITLKVSK